MKRFITSSVIAMLSMVISPCQAQETLTNSQLQVRNIERAIQLTDNAFNTCFSSGTMKMADIYNFETGKSEGVADVWPYTAAIEAVNSILEALNIVKDTNPELYENNYGRYVTKLSNLYTNLEYYRGTFTLNSYASVRSWSVYGVHRGGSIGTAAVKGIENVYDDQMWLLREFLRSYKLTNKKTYLIKAEYLADYIIDGWDCAIDNDGNEYGGITWGPGYNSKHSCSNGPAVSPLVWLAQIYEGSTSTTTRRFINMDGSRTSEKMLKSEFYLSFAKKIYDWQRKTLFDTTHGVYHDMVGGTVGMIQYETYDGISYRKHVDTGGPGGTAYTYNTGTMICGGVDLYNATNDAAYKTDLSKTTTGSNAYFRRAKTINGQTYYYYPFDTDTRNGFNQWFDDVYLRAMVDAYALSTRTVKAVCDNFQRNLDYAYDNHLKENCLPNDLLGGWGSNTVTKPFHQFAFASEYAVLVRYLKESDASTGITSPIEEVADTVDVYSIDGKKMRSNAPKTNPLTGLEKGIYIVDDNKYVVK